MDDATRTELEAAAFRALREHLMVKRPEVQNIDLMNLAGFCRNCLAKWYAAAAAEQGIAIDYDQARERVYGMPYAEWKAQHQAEATPLARMYLLGTGEAAAPVIESLPASQALIGLTANAFVLDIKNPAVLKRNLQAHARLVQEVPVRRLDYPRRYDVLDSVVDAVLADVAG